jgi:tRNA wybutosine-synthesizing protein 4
MVPRVARRSPIINRGYYIRSGTHTHFYRVMHPSPFVLTADPFPTPPFSLLTRRLKAVDHIAREFITAAREQCSGTPLQIISLGAGFDTLFFRLKTAGLLQPGDVVFEVDFSKLVKRKAALIQQSEKLKALLTAPLDSVPNADALQDAMKRAADRSKRVRHEQRAAAAATGESAPSESPLSPEMQSGEWTEALGGGLFTADYRIVGADLCHMPIADARLRAAGVDPARPTLVLSECVLTYIGPQHADKVLGWAGSYFEHAVLANYEQIAPDDAFGVFMQSHFFKQRE